MRRLLLTEVDPGQGGPGDQDTPPPPKKKKKGGGGLQNFI